MDNIPTPINGDEPKSTDGMVWYASALMTVFFLGFFLALLAVGIANKTAARAPLYQPTLLEQPKMLVQPVCRVGVDEGCP